MADHDPVQEAIGTVRQAVRQREDRGCTIDLNAHKMALIVEDLLALRKEKEELLISRMKANEAYAEVHNENIALRKEVKAQRQAR